MFITEEEYKDLDHKTCNMVLERVFNKAIESTLKLLPEVVIGLTVKTKGIQTVFERFKETHPELAGREEDIIKIIEEIELQDGSQDLGEILTVVAAKMQDANVKVPEEQPHTVDEVERLINGFVK